MRRRQGWDASRAKSDVTAFYSPECELNYYRIDWGIRFLVSAESYDCIIGICPDGHRYLLG